MNKIAKFECATPFSNGLVDTMVWPIAVQNIECRMKQEMMRVL